jgi:ketosteroid isomerase-like protein
MKRIAVGFALVFMSSIIGWAQAPERNTDPREQEIRNFFVALDQAVVKRDDVTGSKFLHDEFTFVNPSGLVMNKERFTKFAFAGNNVFEEHQTEELSIRFFGDVAACQGLLKFRVNMNGQARDFQARITVVIVKEKGLWQVFTYHSSTLPPPRPQQSPAPTAKP